MSFRTMHFHGMTINDITLDGDDARIDIGHAIIVKNMDGAEQNTRWYGKGILNVRDLQIDSDELPSFPARVASADIKDNQITYRDEVVIPFRYHGSVGITLQFEGFAPVVRFIGERMDFDVSEHEKYIEHIAK